MPSGPRPRPPTNSIRIALSGDYSGSEFANIFWLDAVISGTPTVGDLETLSTAFAGAWHTNVFTLQSSAAEISGYRSVLLLAGPTELSAAGALALAGTNGTDGEPAQVSAALSWQIAAYYRGGHPKTYMAGMASGHLANVRDLDPTYQAALVSGGAAFIAAVNALTTATITAVTLGTVSFASGNAWRGTPVFRAYGSTPQVHPRIDTQRRRLGKEI